MKRYLAVCFMLALPLAYPGVLLACFGLTFVQNCTNVRKVSI